MQPTWNNVSIAHENGDVEQSHHRFKEAVDQALRVRSSRDFATRAAYEHFLQNLIHKRNQTRREKFSAEKATLRQAYDRLVTAGIERADRDYVRILHLAATTSEAEVETALQIVLEAGKIPSFVVVRDLVQMPTMRTVPVLSTPELNLASYDQLIPS